MMIQAARGRMTAILPSILIMLFTIGYLITAFLTLDAASRRVPVLTGIVTLVLLAIDVLTDVSASTNRSIGGDEHSPSSRGREITAILFVAGGVAGIYFIGFLIAIPLYLVASIAFLGAQPLRIAIIVAVLSSLSIYVIFELALQYQLFPGILFY